MATSKKLDQTATATNARGIPYAPFVDRVEDYVASRAEVEGVLKNFQEMISKYQFMESNTTRRLQGLREKVPDIEKTLAMVRFLRTRRRGGASGAAGAEKDADEDENEDEDEEGAIETTFELNDTLYAKARIRPVDEVSLWLGANIMLTYPLDEAELLLDDKLKGAKTKMADGEEDIDFLREQITTMEVATARVYNWDVTQRRKERDEAAASGGTTGSGSGSSGGK